MISKKDAEGFLKSKADLLEQIENFFHVKIYKDTNSYILANTLLADFLKIFYMYTNSWSPLTPKEINKLKEKWKLPQV
jgi:hypothetical protein